MPGKTSIATPHTGPKSQFAPLVPRQYTYGAYTSMKISFVIPAYNEEKFLGLCLEAVLRHAAHSGVDTEVIVVNNASTDNTRAVAAAYPGVKIIDEPRKGLARARQSGFEASSGDLIANIDADTIMEAHWIPTVLRSFQKDENLVGLSGPHSFYDIPAWRQLLAKSFYLLAYVNYLLHKYILRTASFMQGGNFVVRRTALEKVGGFNPAYTFYGEDADISQRLHKVGNVTFTFSLPIKASGRRLVMEGYLHMAWVYFINYLSTVFLRRAVTTTRAEFKPAQKHR